MSDLLPRVTDSDRVFERSQTQYERTLASMRKPYLTRNLIRVDQSSRIPEATLERALRLVAEHSLGMTSSIADTASKGVANLDHRDAIEATSADWRHGPREAPSTRKGQGDRAVVASRVPRAYRLLWFGLTVFGLLWGLLAGLSIAAIIPFDATSLIAGVFGIVVLALTLYASGGGVHRTRAKRSQIHFDE